VAHTVLRVVTTQVYFSGLLATLANNFRTRTDSTATRTSVRSRLKSTMAAVSPADPISGKRSPGGQRKRTTSGMNTDTAEDAAVGWVVRIGGVVVGGA
jgi:hypothetical protein